MLLGMEGALGEAAEQGEWAHAAEVVPQFLKSQLNIAIILGSTRPGRNGEAVAQWVRGLANKPLIRARNAWTSWTATYPCLTNPYRKTRQVHEGPHEEVVRDSRGVLCVCVRNARVQPQHMGALLNAIDFLNKEWTNKAAGFVS